MDYPRLDSSNGKSSKAVEVSEVTITPLQAETSTTSDQEEDSSEQETGSSDIRQYIEAQNNRVISFIISWIKTNYTKDLLSWIMNDFKREIIKELKK